MTERKRVSLEFYNQLKEPERSEAIENFDEFHCEDIPETLTEALRYGWCWVSKGDVDKWVIIHNSVNDGSYFIKPFVIEDLVDSIYPELPMTSIDFDETDLHNAKREGFIECYNKLKELGMLK